MDDLDAAPPAFIFRHRPSVEDGSRALGLRRRGLADRRTIAVPIVALLVASLLLVLPLNPLSFYAGIAGLAVGLLFLIVNFNNLDPRITAARRASWDAVVRDGQTMSINAEGIRAVGPDLALFASWGYFRELRDDGEILMFWRSPTFAIWLESSAFASIVERNELVAFARTHLLTPRDARPT